MSMRICIIAPTLPPDIDGIGDHTANLAQELSQHACVSILAGCPSFAPIPGVGVSSAFNASSPASVQSLLTWIPTDGPDWVLLQYNPSSYGRWGLNLHLPLVMRAVRRRVPSTQIALMVHEPFVPASNWKLAVMTCWQRWQLRTLAKCSDTAFTSIEYWSSWLRPWLGNTPLSHLPVGSNIPRTYVSRGEARKALGVPDGVMVIGLFGAADRSRQLSLVKSTVGALHTVGVKPLTVYIGAHRTRVLEELQGLNLRAEGQLPPAQVSTWFAAFDMYLAPHIDGVSTRRTSLMTALQHGVAVVGTSGIGTDTLLLEQNAKALLLADAADGVSFCNHAVRIATQPALRDKLAAAAERLYDLEFSWPRIAQRLLQTLSRRASDRPSRRS